MAYKEDRSTSAPVGHTIPEKIFLCNQNALYKK